MPSVKKLRILSKKQIRIIWLLNEEKWFRNLIIQGVADQGLWGGGEC